MNADIVARIEWILACLDIERAEGTEFDAEERDLVRRGRELVNRHRFTRRKEAE